MITLSYAYGIDSVVYHVSKDKGIRKAIVRKVTMEVIPGSGIPSIEYVIAFTDAMDGIIGVDESTLYSDVDLALAFYKANYV